MLGDVVARLSAPAPIDQVVAGVAGGGEDVGTESKLASLEPGQPPQDAYEGLLSGVGRVVPGPEYAKAEVVGAALVALVKSCEGVAVTADRAPSQRRLVCDVRGGSESRHSTQGTVSQAVPKGRVNRLDN